MSTLSYWGCGYQGRSKLIALTMCRRSDSNKDKLPEWYTSSTITGDKTELGKGHDRLQQKIADRKARASALDENDKGDATDARG